MATFVSDEALFKNLLKQALKQECATKTDEEKTALEKLCDDCFEMISKPHAWNQSGNGEGQDVEALQLHVMKLYNEVQTAGETVLRLRQEVPSELLLAMQQDLVQCRPVQGNPDLSLELHHGSMQMVMSGAEQDLGLTSDLDSWRQLTDLTSKVPSLMARLDQTIHRLTRITDISEADQHRPSPRTVEKVLLNRFNAKVTDTEEELGAAHTRKQLAYDLGA